jgi:hypothetical protein
VFVKRLVNFVANQLATKTIVVKSFYYSITLKKLLQYTLEWQFCHKYREGRNQSEIPFWFWWCGLQVRVDSRKLKGQTANISMHLVQNVGC